MRSKCRIQKAVDVGLLNEGKCRRVVSCTECLLNEIRKKVVKGSIIPSYQVLKHSSQLNMLKMNVN
jgi:hypothetical protein